MAEPENTTGQSIKADSSAALRNDKAVELVSGFSDADFQQAVWRALRLSAIVLVVATPVLWWRVGWETAALFVVGALISGSGVYEWLRLMTAVMHQMDAAGQSGRSPRPIAPVLVGFFVRLAIALGLLYGSLKFLHGSVYALIAGLALGVLALLFEGLRLLKSWTL